MNENYYYINSNATVEAYGAMKNESVQRLWHSFFNTEGNILRFVPSENYIFRIGTTKIPNIEPKSEYALCIDSNGIAISSDSYAGLMRGFFSMLMKIEYNQNEFFIKHMSEQGIYKLKNRMIHICVFPENSLYFIKKLIRLSALSQYTHIIIEFWGMLRYDCLKELSWENAFTKSQAAELISECRELGIEPIPMFNQLGHATGARLISGKHVVLDQNPRLGSLFTPDGWAWNIESENTSKLLREVRSELYGLFGNGKFIHIGCDEAYYITRNAHLRKMLPNYLSTLTHEVEAEGRTPIIWMDMLLTENKFEHCYTTGKEDEVAELRAATSKSTVFVDWQYNCTASPIQSLLSLKDSGHKCIGASWYSEKNYKAHISTIEENDMYGFMLTTWHTLNDYMQSIWDCAEKLGASGFPWGEYSSKYEKTALLLRRLSFEGNSYEECGWLKNQIEV